MANDEHILDLLPAYVLGSLETHDSARVEEHLLSCIICRDEADSLQEVGSQLALAVRQQLPGSDLKQRLMERVQAAPANRHISARRPDRRWVGRLLPIWGLASLGLILALGAVSLVLWQRLDRLEFLTSPGGMRAVPLIATEAASGATGFVVVGADGRNGALVVDGLTPPGEGREYQLWLIRNGQWTSGALFSTDEENYGGMRIRAPGSLLEYSAVSITIEPAGGSPKPTGTKVLGGPLFGP